MKRTLLLILTAMLLAASTGCIKIEITGETAPQETETASESKTEAASEPETETSAARNPETSEKTAVSETESEGEQTSVFTSMELNIDRGTLYIRAGDSFSLTRRDGHPMDYEITDQVLHLDQKLEGEAVLMLPEDTSFAALHLTAGEGHVFAESPLSLETLELTVSRGEVTLSQVSVTDSSAIQVSQGSAFLSGSLGASVTAASKEGNLNMELSDAQEDYDYEIELSTGNIHLGELDFRGRSASRTIDNDAGQSMALHCSRGNLSVEFKK